MSEQIVDFEEEELAGFWLRFFAWVIDASVIYLIYALAATAFDSLAGISLSELLGSLVDSSLLEKHFGAVGGFVIHVTSFICSLAIPLFIFGLPYRAIFESSPSAATPGKQLLGLYVVSDENERLSFFLAVIRHAYRSLSFLLLGSGFVLIALTRNQRSLHDILSGAVVLRNVNLSQTYRFSISIGGMLFAVLIFSMVDQLGQNTAPLFFSRHDSAEKQFYVKPPDSPTRRIVDDSELSVVGLVDGNYFKADNISLEDGILTFGHGSADAPDLAIKLFLKSDAQLLENSRIEVGHGIAGEIPDIEMISRDGYRQEVNSRIFTGEGAYRMVLEFDRINEDSLIAYISLHLPDLKQSRIKGKFKIKLQNSEQ